MSGVALNLKGAVCGMLTVLERAERPGAHAWWKCECVCGNTCVRKSSHLVQSLRRGDVMSCGCRPRGGKVKWALLYKGELRSARELAAMTGLGQRRLTRWFERGLMSEARIEQAMARAAWTKAAKAAGLSSRTTSARRGRWGDVEDVYTRPVKVRRVA